MSIFYGKHSVKNDKNGSVLKRSKCEPNWKIKDSLAIIEDSYNT